jgi:hypothetical protein
VLADSIARWYKSARDNTIQGGLAKWLTVGKSWDISDNNDDDDDDDDGGSLPMFP